MPVYSIRGVDVEFPFDAYPVQKIYMEKVIEGLQTVHRITKTKKKHALLESPTGTGKTLCLLCSVLAWHKVEMERRLEDYNHQRMAGNSQDGEPIPPPQRLQIIYASRTHSQLTQVVKELKRCAYS